MTLPRLQVALDTTDLVTALRALGRCQPAVDVIEVGTVLLLAEGLRCVREIRALYPEATILADARIAEAGSILSRQCFEAGADWVSCVAGASLTTVEQVVSVASDHGGEVQVELGGHYDHDQAVAWRQRGVEHVIVHRSRDAEAAGPLSWGPGDLETVDDLAATGFTVTVTGGVTPRGLDVFSGHPVGVVIAGRAIVGAQDPLEAARAMREAMERVWGR
ncbi:orotidine 5'-phosphate decarboxylase / HUMPS family protein [Actinomyces wuliandei]|uniref:orotidine 5'-phosphate decarboxylase / HUMPS family protein n=1 Tax=Actinomyces wuliandei TaxID=2057743 RepID=UPI000FD8CABF|nr:orotidine 5'-phosphate decarboxylase / HUMPS family protein [Actinomyces wuliandei]